MKPAEHNVVSLLPARSAPLARTLQTSSGRPPELVVPGHGTRTARARTTRRSASRWQALTPFRARGAWLYATLRPRAGRTLPLELRAESVSQLAEALPLGVRDAGFERLVARIDTGPVHHGDQVQLFFRGEEAFASLLQAMEGSTREILLETYILRDDATGRKLLGVLGSAAARGVRVRVLADAYGSWTTKGAFWREMHDLGIEARLFRPLWSHLRKSLLSRSSQDHRHRPADFVHRRHECGQRIRLLAPPQERFLA